MRDPANTNHEEPTRTIRPFLLLVVLALLAGGGCKLTSLPLWRSRDADAAPCAVRRVSDIAYVDGSTSHRHQLDLFLPRNRENFPVVVLVHGGAWMIGDNRCCGLYSSVGEYLASQGIAAVLPNYRLTPEVKFPGHVRDVAKAVAWTKNHLGELGGDPSRIFLVGHSAGGHLVALLATDDSYLRDEGMSRADIKGVVACSGVYRISPGKIEVMLGGASADSFRFDTMMPLRRESSKSPSVGPAIPLAFDLFAPVFGDDPAAREFASPIAHVRPGLPPFLIFNAEKDLPTLPEMSGEFHRALLAAGCESTWLTVEGRNHNSLLFRATESNDFVAKSIVDFVDKR